MERLVALLIGLQVMPMLVGLAHDVGKLMVWLP